MDMTHEEDGPGTSRLMPPGYALSYEASWERGLVDAVGVVSCQANDGETIERAEARYPFPPSHRAPPKRSPIVLHTRREPRRTAREAGDSGYRHEPTKMSRPNRRG